MMEFVAIRRHPLKYVKSPIRILLLIGIVMLVSIFFVLHSKFSHEEPLLQGWDRNRSRSLPLYIQPQLKTQLIEPTTLCKENSSILLLIIVSSAVDNFQKRQIIRNTWANTTEFNYSKFSQMHSKYDGNYLSINYPDWKKFVVKNDLSTSSADGIGNKSLDDDPSQANFNIRVVFLLGRTKYDWVQPDIIDESRKYDDIIQENFIDSYNNLTLKSVMMLKWITNNCNGKVKYFMKSDDDIFVNVPNLIHILLGGTIPVYYPQHDNQEEPILSPDNRLKHFDNLLIGWGMPNFKPIRYSTGRWYAPKYMFAGETYPKYLNGPGYVFTIDVAQALYNTSMNVPLMHLEDVYLTGICAEEAHIKRIHYPLFYHGDQPDSYCALRGFVIFHGPNDVEEAYKFLINKSATCGSKLHKKIFSFWNGFLSLSILSKS